jgi:hypothetical protein
VPYTESDGDIEVEIPDSVVEDIMVGAQSPTGGNTAVLDGSSVPEASSMTLQSDDIEKLAPLSVELKLPAGSVKFDPNAISSFVSKGQKIKLLMKDVAPNLTASQKQAIGIRPVFEVSVFKGSQQIRSFGNGMLEVSLPYVLRPGEKAYRLAVYHVSADGKTEKMKTRYDANAKRVIFETSHLSTFYIGYDEWINTYPDVTESAWYYSAVEYVSESGLFSGTDKGFEPDVSMTRAMLVTVLYNYAKPEKGVSGNGFSDVPEGQWYSDPIAWAAANGIVSGYDGKFRPNDPVTRQETFVVMRLFAKHMGKASSDLWSGNLNFADASEVSGWAQESAAWATSNGIVSGKPGNILDPKGTATRAEMATMLMKLIENVI